MSAPCLVSLHWLMFSLCSSESECSLLTCFLSLSLTCFYLCALQSVSALYSFVCFLSLPWLVSLMLSREWVSLAHLPSSIILTYPSPCASQQVSAPRLLAFFTVLTCPSPAGTCPCLLSFPWCLDMSVLLCTLDCMYLSVSSFQYIDSYSVC